MEIKEPQLLFESQIPSALNAVVVAWNTSAIKLQALYKNKEFQDTFLSVYNSEYSQKFNFRDMQDKISQTCNMSQQLADSVAKYTGKKIRFANPNQKKPTVNNVSVSDDINKELESIQQQLTKAQEYLDNKMKDIRSNWTDEMVEKFSERMKLLSNAMNDLRECCNKIQKQMKNKNKKA